MASAVRLIFFVLLFRLELVVTSAGTETMTTAAPLAPPSSPSTLPLADIFSKLGFQELAAVTAAANLSSMDAAAASITVFAPKDSSFLTCPLCSLPLLLLEHSSPGLYTFRQLRNWAFGTKISTLAPNRCLTVTSTAGISTALPTKKVFINGAEISEPDLFNDGRVIVHGLRGLVSHLSPLSCDIERQSTLAFLPQPAAGAIFANRLVLKEAMMRLRTTGYSIVALGMRVRYPELSELKNMTIFAVDDDSIFAGGAGRSYIADLGFHIVPNRLLTASDLITLPQGTVLPTLERERRLVVTDAGDGGVLKPLMINFVKIRRLDAVLNGRVAVHGLSRPFPRIDPHPTA
ncbi:unnamed protein product [Cuscuta campestris]|uniref:FAS1 domain-containing protein n=1 Tax=Cuscuta campestris TaxID=132261 RepID=A0A484K8T2_9ASTE|nr:unnamed protein product [Cuscuta campestris]